MTPDFSVERFASVPMSIEAELGTCELSARELIDLHAGSVLRLSRKIGDDLPLSVGGAPIGQGEIVKLDDGVALRITNVRSEG